MAPEQDTQEPVKEQPEVTAAQSEAAPVTTEPVATVPAVDVEAETPPREANPESTQPTTMQPGAFPIKKSRKGLLAILISVGAVVLLGGTAAGLGLWWTSPDKSFADATSTNVGSLAGIGSVKGSLVVTPKSGADVSVEFTTKVDGAKSNTDLALKMNAGAVTMNLTGAVATDDSKNVYVKVNDVKKTLDSFAGGNAEAVDAYYGKLISKIDGKWVEITPADMKDLSGNTDANSTCVVDTLGKISSDSSYVKELQTIYANNAYLQYSKSLGSELVNGKDSNHVLVTVDKTKLDAFSKAALKSKLFTELSKCGVDTNSASSTETSGTMLNVELWVDKWSHKVTRFVMSQVETDATVKFTLEPDYTKSTVTVPQADTQFKDLKADVTALEEQFTATEQQTLSDGTF